MLSGDYCITLLKVSTCAILSIEYWDKIQQDFFLCNVIWRLLDNIEQDFLLCHAVQTVLRQHWTGFLPVQCFPKSIKTTLSRFFSYAMLSRASWTTCTKFLPVQCYPKSIKTTLNMIFSCAMLSFRFFDNIVPSFYLCNVVPRVLTQHWTRFLPVQCYLETLAQHWTESFPVQCCKKSTETILNRIFTCAMLSQVY